MKYLLIDTQSKSYKNADSWLTRIAIVFLKNKGIISTEQFTYLSFELPFLKGYGSRIKNQSSEEGWEEYKQEIC